MGKYIKILVVFLCAVLTIPLNLLSQSVVIKGGGVVVQPATFWVIQGDLTVKDELSDGKISLDGTVLLSGDITNDTQDSIFKNQETVPDGWVIMPNTAAVQRIKGITPIAFENISFSGSDKILENNNTSVNGIIRLNAIFQLNRRKLILNNKSCSALEHYGGYLFAETNSVEGIGSFQWNISNNIGTFRIPFGSGQSDTSDIPLSYQSTSAGSNAGGIVFSTYPTDNANTPYPEEVNTMAPYIPLLTVNRFWLIDANSYAQKPVSSFILRYTNSDVESNIAKDRLKPTKYRMSDMQWSEYSIFDNNDLNNSMSVLNVNGISFDKNWTITSDNELVDVFFPNAFTPDLNGINETFKPVMNFLPKTFVMYIYDRWGNLVFVTKNPETGWDGRYLGAESQIGTYSWKVILEKPDGKEYQYVGHISIIK